MKIDILLMAAMVVAAVWTVMATRLLRSIIGLALTSAILSVLMFRFNAPIAGVFELSVCAGLIPAIFISTIGLTPRLTADALAVRSKERLRRYWYLPLILIAVAVIMSRVYVPVGTAVRAVAGGADVRSVLWNMRRIDLFGQIVILLGGALAAAILVKELKRE